MAGRNASRGSGRLRRFFQNKAAVLGLAFLIILLVDILFAGQIADYTATQTNVSLRMIPPCAEHLLGTDYLGRDIFAMIVHGARVTVGIGVGCTLISLVISCVLASLCALYRKLDAVLMRVMDTISCVPVVLLAIALMAVLGTGVPNLILVMSVCSVPQFTRMIRSVLLSVVEQDYIPAARVSGTSQAKLIIRHILPNAVGPIVVQATMSVASMMLSAASLSFLNLGVGADIPEWGAMINISGIDQILQAPYTIIAPCAAIALSALAISLVGDGLRDALDPRQRK